jgi:hypothetical protein
MLEELIHALWELLPAPFGWMIFWGFGFAYQAFHFYWEESVDALQPGLLIISALNLFAAARATWGTLPVVSAAPGTYALGAVATAVAALVICVRDPRDIAAPAKRRAVAAFILLAGMLPGPAL